MTQPRLVDEDDQVTHRASVARNTAPHDATRGDVVGAERGPTLRTLLRLGRISNLPTVWTNCLAALALAGGTFEPLSFLVAALAMSFAYTGGMFLNDAFDREIDARERPERPIPSGEISAGAVFALGFGQLSLGVLLVASLGPLTGGPLNLPAVVAALVLCGVIVLYDVHHKQNPLSPLVMGLCRVGVYATVGLAFAPRPLELPWPLLVGALLLLGHLIGLTYVAKQENLGSVKGFWPLVLLAGPVLFGISRSGDELAVLGFVVLLVGLELWALSLLRRVPPRIPQAVITLIAGISLVDAVLLASVGQWALGALAVGGCGLTLGLQRWVRGT